VLASNIKMINKLFYNFAYSVSYRLLTSNDTIPSSSTITCYNSINANNNEWYADPFCFENNDRIFIFMEVKNVWDKPAYIGVSEIVNGRAQKVFKALAEPFHLAYPNLFEFKNNIYMIPETSAVDQLRLYRAVDFPLKWEIDTILLESVKYVDCSLLYLNNAIFLFCCDIESKYNNLLIYNLDIDKKRLTPLAFDNNKVLNHRPAGNLFKYGDSVFRPLQDCSIVYGEKIHICKMISDPSDGYSELLFDTIEHRNIQLNNKVKYSRVHTINRSQNLEVIDMGFNKFYFNKFLWKTYTKLRNITTYFV
jgi:hypothetical protein